MKTSFEVYFTHGLTSEEICKAMSYLPVEAMHRVHSEAYSIYKELLVRDKINHFLKAYSDFDIIEFRICVDLENRFTDEALEKMYNQQIKIKEIEKDDKQLFEALF